MKMGFGAAGLDSPLHETGCTAFSHTFVRYAMDDKKLFMQREFDYYRLLFSAFSFVFFLWLFYFPFFHFCLLDNTGLGSSESFEMINNEITQENSADTGGGK
jgi:hypothetical protein